MIDKNLQKTKVITISALMGNEKLSRAITDGLLSPIGSSKRTKAASILNSFNKTYRLDGQGGGGVVGLNPYGNLPFNQSTLTLPGTPGAGQTVGAGRANVKPNLTLDASGNLPKTSTTPGVAGLPPVNQAIINKALFSAPPEPVKSTTPTAIQPTAITTPAPTPAPTQPGSQQSTATFQPPTISAGDAIDYWYNSLSAADKKRFKPLYEAQKAGIGAKTFTYNLMADKEKFKTLFPNVPEESLPTGASLVGQVNALEASLKKQYKVDELANNLTKLSNRGLIITDDLKGYMTARDEYISTLDKMITEAQDRSLKTDMSNPVNRDMTNNYMNYLYIMKGRQQKRYTDFLNSAINYHNQELTHAETAYNTAYNNFTSTFKKGSALVEEDYNRLSDQLTEMYNNVVSLEGNEAKKQQAEYNLWKSYYDILKTSNEANGTDAKSINKKIIDNDIKNITGADGKVDPNKYKVLRNDIAVNNPDLLAWFDKAYPPEVYINPNQPGVEGWFLTPNKLYQNAEDNSSDWLNQNG